MASDVIEGRLNKINDLKCFLKYVEEKVKLITDELNWNHEELTDLQNKSLAICSVHPEHRVGNSRIKEHEEKCLWLKNGYHSQDIPFPEYDGHGSCVVFTPELQETVTKNASRGSELLGENQARGVPQTSARFDQDFTRAEKLAIYDYVVSNAERQNLYEDFTILAGKEVKTEKKVMTPLEIAAAERDAKRRRASYRNKVHTNRKTQTEILREVIESQMETLTEERETAKTHSDEKHSRHSSMGNPKKEHPSNRSHKSFDYDDHNKSYSSRNPKYKRDRYSYDEKTKKKKRKRSRSRSKSREKSKRRKSSSCSESKGHIRH